jgi:hypothetical protein
MKSCRGRTAVKYPLSCQLCEICFSERQIAVARRDDARRLVGRPTKKNDGRQIIFFFRFNTMAKRETWSQVYFILSSSYKARWLAASLVAVARIHPRGYTDPKVIVTRTSTTIQKKQKKDIPISRGRPTVVRSANH